MGRGALVITSVLALTGSALADVAVGAGVPFTANELTAALAPRGIELVDGTITLIPPSTVELATSSGNHHIDVGATRGPAAARLVALHLVEVEGVVDLPTPGVETLSPPGLVETVRTPTETTWHLALATGAGRGVSAVDLSLLSIRSEATWARGPLRWGGALTWLHGLAKAEDPMQPISAELGVLRGVAGIGVGRFELLAGPALVAYRVRSASGMTWGAGGGLRVQLASTRRWSVTACLDADWFAHRVIGRLDGVEFAATPRLAVTAGLGVRWEGP